MEENGGIFGKAYRLGWKIADRFIRDNITLYSAQTAYFVVVSIIPFAIVLVPVLMLLVPEDTVTLLSSFVRMLPGNLGEIAESVLHSLFQSPGTSVVSLYVILSLWAASKGIMSLQTGLHGIYHVQERDNYFIRRFRCCLYTLILLGVVTVTLFLLVLGNTFEQLLRVKFPFWSSIAHYILAFRMVIAIVIFVVAFTAAYKYLSGARCRFFEAMPGVILTTIAWILFSEIYSYYIGYISRYITLYGSLGALVFLFLWLYFCILILMIGAEFNVFFVERRRRKKERKEEKKEEYRMPKDNSASS